MSNKTPLYQSHLDCGGKMVDFAGWQMPVNYGSQIEEHLAVRQSAGMFDVSHMTIVDVDGPDAADFLRKVVTNDIGQLQENQALYGAVLNAHGNILDDLIIYRLADRYRCVVNAGTCEKMLDWFERQSLVNMRIEHKREVMIALQGPQAVAMLAELEGVPSLIELAPFYAMAHEKNGQHWLIGRTGYTGEDGVEIMLPADAGVTLWADLLAKGVVPAGLGARDTLRLEAGLNLYGQDIDESTNPLESNMGWTVAWEPIQRQFIGRAALENKRAGVAQKLTGVVLEDKGILRHGQQVETNAGPGVITSGTYSPTMEYSIALARVPKNASGDCQVDIRGKLKKARFVKPPFVRRGKILVS